MISSIFHILVLHLHTVQCAPTTITACSEPANLTARFLSLNPGGSGAQFFFPVLNENILPPGLPRNNTQFVKSIIENREVLYRNYAGSDCQSSLPINGSWPIEVVSKFNRFVFIFKCVSFRLHSFCG